MIDAQDELWAWVTEDNDGKISMIGHLIPGVGHTPLMSHNKEVVLEWESIAKEHGAGLGQPVWLRRYTVTADVGMIAAKLRMRN